MTHDTQTDEETTDYSRISYFAFVDYETTFNSGEQRSSFELIIEQGFKEHIARLHISCANGTVVIILLKRHK